MKGFGKKLTILSATLCVTAAGTALAEDADTQYVTDFGNVIQGDAVNAVDMEAVQKNILSISELDDEALDRADVDRNGAVNVSDMEAIQKNILGIESIENLHVIKTNGTVSVHDPSIIQDKDGTYYIFGSHMAWAKSTDLCNWTTFTNNINTNYATLFADPAKWAQKGSTTYDLSGNLWAPDVVWNDTMNKWCMYMSVNGDNWYSSIVLLTADKLDGSWTYVGPVVYSGFVNATDAASTDYTKATGEAFDSTAVARYTKNRNGNHIYGLNAIDPCIVYDGDDLWMTYGSWFGGIYMLKIDPATGLRDYSYTYETVEAKSDIYQGIKIAGGEGVSGEASYIQKIDDYYYLFMSYGGLVANGGYNMRVFRSESITGPYVDALGKSAIYTSTTANLNGSVGIRLMSYYKWNTMELAQVAQGHNSAFVDTKDGKSYVVYHTRTNDGSEGHYVKTHQLFVNEDGWLVAAPYRYSGETLKEDGYSKSQVIGVYDVLFQKPSVNNTNLEYCSPVSVELKSDGTVTGAYSGTWTLTKDTPYITLNLGDKTYKGVVLRQIIEGTSDDTMCFTLLGVNDQIEVWGSKHLQGIRAIRMAMDSLTVASVALDDMDLPETGAQETKITWSSDQPDVIAADGTVTLPEKETEVTLTATFENSGIKKTKEYKVKVFEAPKNATDPYVIAKYLTGEEADLSKAVEGTYAFANPFNESNTSGLELYNGAAIQFDVKLNGTMDRLNNIIAFTDAGSGKLYFTGGSYLGYNATGGFFDANMANWALQKDYIGKGATVRIDFLPDGYQVSVNGEVAYTNKTVDAGTTKGSNSISGYNNVLSWLNYTSTTLNLGWGSWWNDNNGYPGTISNIVCYAYPTDKIDTSGYAYYQDFKKGKLTEWSASESSSLSVVNDGGARGNYLKYAANASVAANRAAYAKLDLSEEITGKYTVSVDASMTAGVLTQRSSSAFAILGTDAQGVGTDGAVTNSAVTSGYIVKLVNTPPKGTKANQTDTSNQTKWQLNDTDTYVDIPVATWVTIKAEVDTTAKTAVVTITNCDDGTVYYSGTVQISGSGSLGGVQILRGRGIGTMSVDTIAVKKSE